MYNMDSIVSIFIIEFPEYEQKLKEHLDFNDELLTHVFFGNEVNPCLIELLNENKDKEKLELYFNFFEEQMYNEGELYVRQVLSTTILANIGDDPNNLRTAFSYMGLNTRKLSNEIEDFLGRKRVVEVMGKNNARKSRNIKKSINRKN